MIVYTSPLLRALLWDREICLSLFCAFVLLSVAHRRTPVRPGVSKVFYNMLLSTKMDPKQRQALMSTPAWDIHAKMLRFFVSRECTHCTCCRSGYVPVRARDSAPYEINVFECAMHKLDSVSTSSKCELRLVCCLLAAGALASPVPLTPADRTLAAAPQPN